MKGKPGAEKPAYRDNTIRKKEASARKHRSLNRFQLKEKAREAHAAGEMRRGYVLTGWAPRTHNTVKSNPINLSETASDRKGVRVEGHSVVVQPKKEEGIVFGRRERPMDTEEFYL